MIQKKRLTLLLPILLVLVACSAGSNSGWYPATFGKVIYSESSVTIRVNESTTITATYSGGNFTSNSILVNFLIGESNIASVMPESCNIKINQSCALTLIGKESGQTYLTSTAMVPSGYESVIIQVTP